MAAIGTENSKACMLFILRMLHAQLQRQVRLPEDERPRVPLIVDEAHYVADGENVVDQIATHRAAGLEPAFGLQYFAQLGSASEHEQKILKGVLNLLQSRFLFRMGDAQDAEQATRIAMAVYATMIRDDPDSRARLRVTPEQALNFPNYHCLASWIADGTRIPSFIGQTYPLPDQRRQWAEQHLAAHAERVGPYPEELASTLVTSTTKSERGETGRPRRQAARGINGAGRPDQDAAARRCIRPDATNLRRMTNAAHPAARRVRQADDVAAPREVRVDVKPASRQPAPRREPGRRVARRRSRHRGPHSADHAELPPRTLRELAFFDRINEIGAPTSSTGPPASAHLRRRLRDPHAARPRRARATQR